MIEPSSSRTLDRTCLGDEPDDVLWDRHLEMIEQRLLPKNRDAVLEIRKLDVGDHSPLKARHSRASRPGISDGGRSLVRRSGGRLVERVEGVEELLLRCLLSLQELHVVDEEEVGLAKSPAKVLRWFDSGWPRRARW